MRSHTNRAAKKARARRPTPDRNGFAASHRLAGSRGPKEPVARTRVKSKPKPKPKPRAIQPGPPDSHVVQESAIRLRALGDRAPDDLRDPRRRAALSLECWKFTREEYWLRCASADAEEAGASWDELCREVSGSLVEPPEPKK